MVSSDPTSSPPPNFPSSSQPTPKRKRSPVPPTPPRSSPSNMRLSTDIPDAVLLMDTDDEELITESPRTKVAYHFQGLQLEEGSAVSKLDLRKGNAPVLQPRDESFLEESAIRKRVRVLGGKSSSRSPEREIPETPASKSFQVVIGAERVVDPMVAEKAGKVVLHNEIDPVIFKGATMGTVRGGRGMGRGFPSMNRLSDAKSRGPKKRMGSPPPLFGLADASLEVQSEEEEGDVMHTDRAALTWHDHEITGHDPNDPDDDGEGINGIGFRPTPAMAYARTEKRRMQMAEYRSREAKDERAKRSERRKGNEPSKVNRDEAETARRVRFLEAESKSIASKP